MEVMGEIIFPFGKILDSDFFGRVRMIVEVRSYRIKPGHREEFVELFVTRAIPALQSHGMSILGPMLDLENPNKFVWLRGFPSLEGRDEMKNAFYESDLWKKELEAIAMPMLESYDVILCETSSAMFVTDFAKGN
jgi:NIPSNAP